MQCTLLYNLGVAFTRKAQRRYLQMGHHEEDFGYARSCMEQARWCFARLQKEKSKLSLQAEKIDCEFTDEALGMFINICDAQT